MLHNSSIVLFPARRTDRAAAMTPVPIRRQLYQPLGNRPLARLRAVHAQ